VVRVSATYGSARPRGEACSIPAGSTMTTESNSSPLACSGGEDCHRGVEVLLYIMYIIGTQRDTGKDRLCPVLSRDSEHVV